MKRSHFTDEQIAYALRQVEAGAPVADICRQLGCSEASFYIWKKRYTNLGITEPRELRQEREENARLKRLVADLTLDEHILTEVVQRKPETGTAAGIGALDTGAVLDRNPSRVSAGGSVLLLLVQTQRRLGSIGAASGYS